MGQRVDVYFVCSAKYHDTDFARLELLKLFYELGHDVRVKIGEDYSNVEAIANADALVTYTCDLMPSAEQVQVLDGFLHSGKKWFALHGTNSILEFLEDGRVSTPRKAPEFMAMLGSQFIAHPPIQEYTVENCCPSDPLVNGIGSFKVTDELYLSEYHGDNKTLLKTQYSGTAEGFEEDQWLEQTDHKVMYRHPHGKGEVLYLTLGHCRSKYDLQPLVDEFPDLERCAWETEEYYELLRRGLRWVCDL